ncbi:MAG: hypothetical protein Q9195_008029 [Heterodermia aff. obscurata]
MAFAPFDIAALVKQINSSSNSLSQGKDEDARQQCLAAARSLCSALETPLDSALRLCYSDHAYRAAIRIGIELKLFEKLGSGNDQTATTSELANATGADPELLAAMGTIYEVDADKFLPTALSKALAISTYSDGIIFSQDVINRALESLHEYLARNKYRNPIEPTNAAFQLAFNTSDHVWEYLQKNDPQKMAQFNNHMASTQAGLPTSLSDPRFYPFNERLVMDADKAEDAVFMVDVAGGKGHDLVEICRNHPDFPGLLVLQEQQSVIAEATGLEPRIQTMVHDFFSPQPVESARVYHLHRILHDWPDNLAHDILSHIRTAMKPGYSKLLINEIVIPAKGAHLASTGLDLVMMAVFSAAQRTEDGWKRLLEGTGFRVLGIWEGECGGESLIECEVAS